MPTFRPLFDFSEGGAQEGSDFIPIKDRRIRWSLRPQDDRVNPRTDTANDAPFVISITDDDIPEPTEYLEVRFRIDSTGYAFPSAIARVTILDDDDGGGKIKLLACWVISCHLLMIMINVI